MESVTFETENGHFTRQTKRVSAPFRLFLLWALVLWGIYLFPTPPFVFVVALLLFTVYIYLTK